MAATNIQPGDRVLDIGCGTGKTTREAACEAGGGSALGVDLSAQMIDLARRLAARQSVTSVRFERADAQIHPFPAGSFDLAISRTGTMFFGDPGAAFANIAQAIHPGGRLVLLVWQGPGPNAWIRELSGALAAGRDLPPPPVDAPGPFSQSDPKQVKAVLSATGFSDIEFEPLSGPMWFGSNPDDAHRFVVGLMGWMLDGVDASVHNQALENLKDTIGRHASEEGVTFESSTWLIRATRS